MYYEKVSKTRNVLLDRINQKYLSQMDLNKIVYHQTKCYEYLYVFIINLKLT